MHDRARTANLLGATALAVGDLALAGAARAAGVSVSGASALVVLYWSRGVGVTELGRRVGLTQSAAARMVDSLEEAGLVERRRGEGRSVTVACTRAGRRLARDLLTARDAPLTHLLGALDDEEHQALAVLLAKLLDRAYGEIGDTELLCRFCDRGACTDNAVCPVGQAERDRPD
ncbi:MarR family transcriptional regulator [Actinoallomurus sp. NBC_01490]|uniref:MarR family winged helix-turn-helix transcriptional regulator n=1 Tax=Actinoallomurus sp. NBC_01490 TaxID=2903557 RepID=UPI002E33C83A|nr:MarR family transcriptional regulator [Actinoallomurus sp. NBC_01490]